MRPWFWAATALFSLPATAAVLDPGFKVRAGGFWAQVDSSFGTRLLDGSLGGRIDFETDLALDDDEFSPFFELAYRFDDHHKVAFNFIRLHRNGTSINVDESFEFTWDDTDYRVETGARIEATLDVDIYQLYYAYSLWHRDDWAVIGTLGVHVMDMDARLYGEIAIEGETDPFDIQASEAEGDLTAPLPDIGLLVKWQPVDRVILTAVAQYLEAEVSDYDGRLLDTRIEAIITFGRHLAVGAAWQEYDLDVERDKSRRRDDDYEFSYQGPSLVLYYEF